LMPFPLLVPREMCFFISSTLTPSLALGSHTEIWSSVWMKLWISRVVSQKE
jgi:hypothetical protein